MADKREIASLLREVEDADPASVFVCYTTRTGNLMQIKKLGYDGNDGVVMASYLKHRLDRITNAYFFGHAPPESKPPVLANPVTGRAKPLADHSEAISKFVHATVQGAKKKKGKR